MPGPTGQWSHANALSPGVRSRHITPGGIMCTFSFLDRAELIEGLTALIAQAHSPELREFHVFDLRGSELPWRDLGISVAKGQEVTFLLGGRVWLVDREQDLWVEPG